MAFLLGTISKIGSFLGSLTRWRKKKTTIEQLESLDKDIKEFEKYKQTNEQNERKYIAALMLYSILAYSAGALIYYIYFMPKNLTDRFKTLIPFLISPLIIYCIRKFLKWFYIKRIVYYETRLSDLNEEKKKILEDVKENETYKKAREILDRFSGGLEITPPMSPANATISQTPASTPFMGNSNRTNPQMQRFLMSNQHIQMNKSTPNNLNATTIAAHSTTKKGGNKFEKMNNGNQSMIVQPTKSMISNGSQQTFTAPAPPPPKSIQSNGEIKSDSVVAVSQMQQQPPPSSMSANQQRTLLPRPIVTPNRTFFDKILDFVIGDGPNNR
jgi:hypothetical protein